MVIQRQKDTIALFILVLLAGGFQTAARADISITGGWTFAQGYSGLYEYEESYNTPGDTVTATLTGFFTSTSSTFSATSLSNSFTQSRAGTYGYFTYGAVSSEFTANYNEPFLISGSFASTSGQTFLGASLYDYTSAVYLFNNFQDHLGGTTLTLGNTAGNNANGLTGSLAGNLIGGHQYSWYVEAANSSSPLADGGSTGSGWALLQLNTVPEPSSLALLGIAAMGIAVYWRRRK